MRFRSLLALAVCLAFASTPVVAYTVVLKDGSRIEAKQKYVIEGDKAIITLVSGTQTFLAASEIDIEGTEEANEQNLGRALVLEDGQFVQKSISREEARRRERLGDLIERGEASMRGTSRDPSGVPDGTEPVASSTLVEQVERRPLRNLELATQILSAFQDRGVEQIALFQGTEQTRALVELTADSEASVFRGLEVAADVLLSVRDNFPDDFDAVELLLMTSNKQRAGEFELTSELAEMVKSGDSDLSSVFVQHVRF